MTDTSLIEAVAHAWQDEYSRWDFRLVAWEDLWEITRFDETATSDEDEYAVKHTRPYTRGSQEAIEAEFDGIRRDAAAKAAIAAVRLWEAENGWRCMPVVTDKAMCGAAHGIEIDVEDDGRAVKMDRIAAPQVWEAMVSASPPPPGSVKE